MRAAHMADLGSLQEHLPQQDSYAAQQEGQLANHLRQLGVLEALARAQVLQNPTSAPLPSPRHILSQVCTLVHIWSHPLPPPLFSPPTSPDHPRIHKHRAPPGDPGLAHQFRSISLMWFLACCLMANRKQYCVRRPT